MPNRFDAWYRWVQEHHAEWSADTLARQAYEMGKAELLTELGDELTHVVRFAEDGWTMKHPLACRPDLFECPMNDRLTEYTHEQASINRSTQPLGVYEVSVNDENRLVLGRRLRT